MLVIHSPDIYQPSPLRPTPQSTRLLVSIVQSSEGVCSLTLTFFLPLLSLVHSCIPLYSYAYFLSQLFDHVRTRSLSSHYEQAKEWLWMWRRASFSSQRSNFFVFKRPSDDWILPSNLPSNLGKGANNQNGNLRWYLPWRGGSQVPYTYSEKWFFEYHLESFPDC